MKKSVAWLFPIALSASAAAPLYDWVYYWGTDVPPPNGVLVDGHPCGSVVFLGTDSVPAHDLPWLKADTMHEIDESGQILRSWRVPVDHYPLDLDGNDLVIAHGSSPMHVLRLTSQGKLEPSPTLPVPESMECPGPLAAEFYCIRVPHNRSHLLASHPICT
jgi:hypothetical protein